MQTYERLFLTVTLSKFYTAVLTKLCGGVRVIDLLLYKPISYVDRRKSLSDAKVGEIATFIAKVQKHEPPGVKKKPYKIIVESNNRCIFIVFFNYSIKYLYKLFPPNSTVIISGKLEIFVGQLQITHPDYVLLDLNQFKETACIEPIYQTSRGITSKNIKNIINFCLKDLPNLPEWIDNEILNKKGWFSWQESIIRLHQPNSLAEIEICRERLAYDELYAYQMALKLIRTDNLKRKERQFTISNKYKDQVLSKLPFQLTSDQIKAIAEISEKQKSEYHMINLLQGDVGSGKTVVALFVMLNAIENGLQAAFMVPTTILAEQHYNWIEEILSCTDIKVALLTGKSSRKEKKLIVNELASGISNIVVGTHALFQDNIIFKNLGLVVVDEQQRFGVMQRYRLIEKGNNADILFITATPIPRTLQQAIYGDIDCSILKEKPQSRSKIKTVAINIEKVQNVIDRLKIAIDKGEKAYWICPYIEENENLDIAAAEVRFQKLRKVFTNRVGIIHGRLTQDEKNQVMFSFKKGAIVLLVATTVIEVGIDIPDATIMIVENAEQFGLSQLHQLRGRVGRGNKPSFCILLYSGYLNKTKLKIICESQDGFYIAEKDLMIRGSGNILGIKQSGHIGFKFADMCKDQGLFDLIHIANDIKELLDIFGYENKLNL
ncbi:ATP-dependent DNA helicase RecG [Wolbachia pipientis]|uniref:ATP-dependent DNA helicase RecG n=1 Tax=Wolbachia pipientis TaxID=955 RepID=A0A1E7QIV9_WOLPI|nr:ATP-dependent DNA helicase RecG [Wolbachia pipientis]OEY86408.1 ATP-dependent DNA helicase RecG [Wolbachia pipientis]